MNEYTLRVIKGTGGIRQVTAYKNGQPVYLGQVLKFSELSAMEREAILTVEALADPTDQIERLRAHLPIQPKGDPK